MRHHDPRKYKPLAARPLNANGSMDEAVTGSGHSVAASSTTQPTPSLSIAPISSMEATLHEFNRQVAMALLGPQQMQQVQPSTRQLESVPEERQPTVPPHEPQQQVHSGGKRRRVAADEEKNNRSHVLMPNLGEARILCRVCSKRGLKTRSRYGCVQCRLGFHVECFAVFHHPELFATNPSDTVQNALNAIVSNSASRPATRRRENHSIMSFEQLTLPSTSDIDEI